MNLDDLVTVRSLLGKKITFHANGKGQRRRATIYAIYEKYCLVVDSRRLSIQVPWAFVTMDKKEGVCG